MLKNFRAVPLISVKKREPSISSKNLRITQRSSGMFSKLKKIFGKKPNNSRKSRELQGSSEVLRAGPLNPGKFQQYYQEDGETLG